MRLMKFLGCVWIGLVAPTTMAFAQDDPELKMSVLKYTLTKENQAEYEMTVERARDCSMTWLYFRSIAVVTDQLAGYNDDFSFKSTDWMSLHWIATMTVLETLHGETDIGTARLATSDKVAGWDFDTKIAWAGICYIAEDKRVPYNPELMKDYGQPGDYDENGKLIE